MALGRDCESALAKNHPVQHTLVITITMTHLQDGKLQIMNKCQGQATLAEVYAGLKLVVEDFEREVFGVENK